MPVGNSSLDFSSGTDFILLPLQYGGLNGGGRVRTRDSLPVREVVG